MKKVTAGLLKQFTLLVALIITTFHLFVNAMEINTMIILQVIFGLLYLFFSVAEFSNSMAKMNLPVDRFFYLPHNIISHRIIKIGALSIAAAVLWVAAPPLAFLSALLLVIIVTDILVFTLKIKQKAFFISIYANYIDVFLSHETKVFASQVKSVEFRYDMFFFTLHNKRTISVSAENVPESQKDSFIEKLANWALRNQLTFTEEAKQQLTHIISSR